MLSKDEFKKVLGDEIRIIRHLATKLDGADGSYSPGEGMRTLDELLGYMSVCITAPADCLVKDDWSGVGEWMTRAGEVNVGNFDAAMGRQAEEIMAMIDGVPEADLTGREVGLPWGERLPLGEALHSSCVRFVVAYRMQLFLYLKQTTHPEMSTSNCWLGQDAPPAEG